ncbi:MAG: ADP-ribosylglycohydrolase family protein, partial [Actinobacteria bacterium]|nr:ADP-ribosylglycohydrolase family protein [Actinomycetota bacterium]
VGEEALAIGVACALGAKGFEDGVLAAVNHSGDSDSTGSITGNLLGAIHGVAAIPTRWLDALEARAIIDQIACDLHDALAGRPPTWPSTHGWWDRYPGW